MFVFIFIFSDCLISDLVSFVLILPFWNEFRTDPFRHCMLYEFKNGSSAIKTIRSTEMKYKCPVAWLLSIGNLFSRKFPVKLSSVNIELLQPAVYKNPKQNPQEL